MIIKVKRLQLRKDTNYNDLLQFGCVKVHCLRVTQKLKRNVQLSKHMYKNSLLLLPVRLSPHLLAGTRLTDLIGYRPSSFSEYMLVNRSN